MTTSKNFGTRSTLTVGGREVAFHDLTVLERDHGFEISRMPYSHKVLLENLLRFQDGKRVDAGDVEALATAAGCGSEREIAFTPARVLMQDFTGVPAVVDLAAMRDAMVQLGGDAKKINPLEPAELVIDHSVQVDHFGNSDALAANTRIEYERNRERYGFLRWGQSAFENFKVVPPGAGIVHQVNLEYLARVVMTKQGAEGALPMVFPDTVVGTDSHTTMINGLGVLGWGVGGIEAEAAMLGQPVSMLIPDVIGMKLVGELPEGATATDLVLRIVEVLRAQGVVGKFVEFYGPGLKTLPLSDRATIANMGPEYGATCGIFPVDEETIRFLRFSGRDSAQVDLVEAYTRAQGMFLTDDSPEPVFKDSLSLDIGDIEPSLSGPRRPQDRVALTAMKSAFEKVLPSLVLEGREAKGSSIPVSMNGESGELSDGSIVIAAITSCTNTSNPSVMVAAGLVARNAVAKGLAVKPWIKTSLAPGSRVVTDYLEKAGLTEPLAALGFHHVGYGCTTCIGNSGPLTETVAAAVAAGKLVVGSVLSGNRNFEGRIHQHVRANYLASPPLVVAFAIAGRLDVDLSSEPLGLGSDGQPVMLADIWPSNHEVAEAVQSAVTSEMFTKEYGSVFDGDEVWRGLEIPEGDTYAWDPSSTYVRSPPYFDGMGLEPEPVQDIVGARALAVLGDSITTDHISPAGAFTAESPAGQYLLEHGIQKENFNTYGSRRGNHEIMMRGTFANVRLRNQLAPGTEGGFTRHLPDGESMTIFDASRRYADEGTPLVVLAGAEYGTGSSRDWAGKGPALLGVRAVIAKSYERIHRSNLIGMGVLPLQFLEAQDRESLGLSGEERFDILGVADGLTPRKQLEVVATSEDGSETRFQAMARIDTPVELDYFRNGGILKYVLRNLAS